MEVIPLPLAKGSTSPQTSPSTRSISAPSTSTQAAVRLQISAPLCPPQSKLTSKPGGVSYDWGNLWARTHGAACAAAGKPCLFEEYGAPSDHCAIEVPWQTTAVGTTGIAGDLFWQWGDTLSTGQTHNDGNTIYYGSDEYTCLVTEHMERIAAR
jgi:hypothetical protein